MNDTKGNFFYTDNLINQTLPANGNPIQLMVNQNTFDFTYGGFTVTLTTVQGQNFTSATVYAPFY